MPLWMESFWKIRTLCLAFPLYLQQQVQGHTAGVQKTCGACERMNISSDSRFTTIKETSPGPLNVQLPLLSRPSPNQLCSWFSYLIQFCSRQLLGEACPDHPG